MLSIMCIYPAWTSQQQAEPRLNILGTFSALIIQYSKHIKMSPHPNLTLNMIYEVSVWSFWKYYKTHFNKFEA